MLSNTGNFRDRNPGTIAAGKLFNAGDTARNCMTNLKRPKTPEEIHKFRCSTKPSAGKTRIFYGRYNDPDIASLLCHGVNTKPSYIAGQLVNPNPQSYFKYRLNEKREDAVYASRQRAPLGRSHDQRKGLPEGKDPETETFGLPVIKDCCAGELVSPAKSYKQVNDEAKLGLELYKKSHSAYTVGESYDRRYDWQRIPKTSCFGIDTPHDNRGLNTKKTLKWLHETMSEKAAHITSKQVDDFRERQIPQVGIVHDPIKDTLNKPLDHVFGIMVKPDEWGAGDLIHMRKNGNFLRGTDRERGFLSAIRQHLKKANYHNFDDLKAAFTFYDRNENGAIDINDLKKVCMQFKLPVQTEVLEKLLSLCDPNNDGYIDYVEFVNFLNWKDKLPTGFGKEKGTAYEERIKEHSKSSGLDQDVNGNVHTSVLKNQIDKDSDYTTSSSVYGDPSRANKEDIRHYGIPTIRSDLPAPRIRRIGDNTNYGDESDAHGLINPSIYSNRGVYEEDFFKCRQPNEIRRICDSIGVEMTNELFQEIWDKAREVTQNGEVSVESFRSVLDEQVTEQFEKMGISNDSTNFQDTLKTMKQVKPAIYQAIDTKSKELITV